jgi:hypothetical protein
MAQVSTETPDIMIFMATRLAILFTMAFMALMAAASMALDYTAVGFTATALADDTDTAMEDFMAAADSMAVEVSTAVDFMAVAGFTAVAARMVGAEDLIVVAGKPVTMVFGQSCRQPSAR